MIYFKNIEEFAQAVYAAFGSTTSYSKCVVYYCEHPKGVRFCVKLVPHKKELFNREYKQGQTGTVENEIAVLRAIKTKIIDPGYSSHLCEILAATTIESFDIIKKFNARCEEILHDVAKYKSSPIDKLCLLRDQSDVDSRMEPKFSLIFLENIPYALSDLLIHNMPPISSRAQILCQALLFQVVWTLAVLNRVFPGFRHNDLHIGNIRVIIKAADLFAARSLDYEMDGRKWRVPYQGYLAKIIDFGFTEIPTENLKPPSGIYAVANPKYVNDLSSFAIDVADWCEDHKDLNLVSDIEYGFLSWLSNTNRDAYRATQLKEMAKNMITPEKLLFDGKTFELFERLHKENFASAEKMFRAPPAKTS